jgi:hypothetical protein
MRAHSKSKTDALSALVASVAFGPDQATPFTATAFTKTANRPMPRREKPPVTLSEHMRRAVKARWAKQTPEQRSAHAKKLVAAREAKRAARKLSAQRNDAGMKNAI